MEADRRNRISDLYHAALEQRPDERAAFVKAAADGDEPLRQEVESLLAYDSASSRSLEAPAAAVLGSGLARADVVGRRIGS